MNRQDASTPANFPRETSRLEIFRGRLPRPFFSFFLSFFLSLKEEEPVCLLDFDALRAYVFHRKSTDRNFSAGRAYGALELDTEAERTVNHSFSFEFCILFSGLCRERDSRSIAIYSYFSRTLVGVRMTKRRILIKSKIYSNEAVIRKTRETNDRCIIYLPILFLFFFIYLISTL